MNGLSTEMIYSVHEYLMSRSEPECILLLTELPKSLSHLACETSDYVRTLGLKLQIILMHMICLSEQFKW